MPRLSRIEINYLAERMCTWATFSEEHFLLEKLATQHATVLHMTSDAVQVFLGGGGQGGGGPSPPPPPFRFLCVHVNACNM